VHSKWWVGFLLVKYSSNKQSVCEYNWYVRENQLLSSDNAKDVKNVDSLLMFISP
jgi:hypothetical protein